MGAEKRRGWRLDKGVEAGASAVLLGSVLTRLRRARPHPLLVVDTGGNVTFYFLNVYVGTPRLLLDIEGRYPTHAALVDR